MDIKGFSGNVVGVVVAVIMICLVAVPVLSTAVGNLSPETDGDIIQLLQIIPLLLVVAVIVAIVGIFISRRE